MESVLRRLSAILVSLTLVASAHADIYTVTSLADPGDGVCDNTCTFRDAILAANARAGQDRIDFGAVTAAAPVSIYLSRGLPAITDSVILDASIQETRDLPGSPDRRPGIVLDLSGAAPVISPLGLPFFANGLSILGPDASDTLVRGLVINGIEPGVSQFCPVPLLNPNPQDPSEPDVVTISGTVTDPGDDQLRGQVSLGDGTVLPNIGTVERGCFTAPCQRQKSAAWIAKYWVDQVKKEREQEPLCCSENSYRKWNCSENSYRRRCS